jgi:hypothetical protein
LSNAVRCELPSYRSVYPDGSDQAFVSEPCEIAAPTRQESEPPGVTEGIETDVPEDAADEVVAPMSTIHGVPTFVTPV